MPTATRSLRQAQRSGAICEVQLSSGETVRGTIHSVSFRTVWVLTVPNGPTPDTGDRVLKLTDVQNVRVAPAAGAPAA